MADTEIGDNVTIRKAIIANNVKIADNINIGDGEKITVVGEKKIIDSQSLVFFPTFTPENITECFISPSTRQPLSIKVF